MRAHDRLGLAGITLGFGLADANDRGEAGGDGGRYLGGDIGIRLAVILAALGMAENDVIGTGFLDERRGYIPGMRTLEICVAILPAKRDVAPGEGCGKPVQQGKGRADQDVHMLGRLAHRIRIGGDIRQSSVHFPVSRNELPQCVILPSVGNYLNRPWAWR